MGGEHGVGVEDAHGLQGGRDDEGAAHVAMGDGVVVGVEAHVGGFGDGDLDALLAGEGVVGERKQVGAFFGEDLGDGALAVFGAGAFGGGCTAPLLGLGVEVIEVVEVAGATGRGSKR